MNCVHAVLDEYILYIKYISNKYTIARAASTIFMFRSEDGRNTGSHVTMQAHWYA